MPMPSIPRRAFGPARSMTGTQLLLSIVAVCGVLSWIATGGITSMFKKPSMQEQAARASERRGPLLGEDNPENIFAVSTNEEILQVKRGHPFVVRFTVQAYPGYKWTVKSMPSTMTYNGDRIIKHAKVKGAPGAAEQLMSFTSEAKGNTQLMLAFDPQGVPAPPQGVPDVMIRIHTMN